MSNNAVIEQVRQAVEQVVDQMRQQPIPVGVSNRHLHLCAEDFDALFPGQTLTPIKSLRQPGHFAAEQTVTLVGPKGKLERVRILGPLRRATQVEVSYTDARSLGLKAPMRMSGDLDNTPGVILRSDFGEVSLKQGVIVAQRHIHMSPMDATIHGVSDGDLVKVTILGTDRRATFDDVAIRVDPKTVAELHLDTDEANAAAMGSGAGYAILSRQ